MALFIKHTHAHKDTHTHTKKGFDFQLPCRALMSESCNWPGLVTGLSSVNTVRLRSPGSLQMDPGQEIQSPSSLHHSVSVPTQTQIGPVEESGIGQRSGVPLCFVRSDKSASVGRSDSQKLTESSLYRKAGRAGKWI